MAVPEIDVARIRKWAEGATPEHVRDQLWIELDVDARSVTIVECRPPWQPDAADVSPMRVPVAKLRYVATRKEWELYWTDRNSRFRRYDALPSARQVGTLIKEVDSDPFCLFWG